MNQSKENKEVIIYISKYRGSWSPMSCSLPRWWSESSFLFG